MSSPVAPGAQRAFKFKLKPTPPLRNVDRAEAEREAERLEGVVQGKRASDIEERYARSLDKNPRVDGYDFIVHEITGANLPGEAQLDFLVYSGGQQFAVQVDGAFAHKTAEQKQHDAVQDTRLSEALKDQIAAPAPVAGLALNGLIARIPGWMLATQASADQLAQEMY